MFIHVLVQGEATKMVVVRSSDVSGSSFYLPLVSSNSVLICPPPPFFFQGVWGAWSTNLTPRLEEYRFDPHYSMLWVQRVQCTWVQIVLTSPLLFVRRSLHLAACCKLLSRALRIGRESTGTTAGKHNCYNNKWIVFMPKPTPGSSVFCCGRLNYFLTSRPGQESSPKAIVVGLAVDVGYYKVCTSQNQGFLFFFSTRSFSSRLPAIRKSLC